MQQTAFAFIEGRLKKTGKEGKMSLGNRGELGLSGHVLVCTRPQMSAPLKEKIKYWKTYVVEESFSMAPTVVRESGRLTSQLYEEQHRIFREFDVKCRMPYFRLLSAANGLRARSLESRFYGIGHGDDTVGVLPYLLLEDWNIRLLDILPPEDFGIMSRRALEVFESPEFEGRRENFPEDPACLMDFGDIESEVQDEAFNPDNVMAVASGRCAYHLEPGPFRCLMCGLARIVTRPGRLVFLIHHLPELNPDYVYKTSVPGYDRASILEPMRKVAGSGVDILFEDSLKIFDYQWLTWMVIGQRNGWSVPVPWHTTG